MIETFPQATRFLENLILAEPRNYRQRARHAQRAIRRLLARVDNPQRHLAIIHIAGSKGKGSTALLLEAILLQAGYRVGTFTSPHLQRWTERFRVDGQELAAARFVRLMEGLRPHVGALQRQSPAQAPSFFDTLTAAALVLFHQQALDYVILETGLGGRLDATNIVTPKICCITSIELEHTDKLGHTLAAIASEKAGIIKPRIPVVTGDLPAAAARVVSDRATALQAPLFVLQRDFHLTRLDSDCNGTRARLQLADKALPITLQLPLLGEQVAYNAALAAVCVQQLGLFTAAELATAIDTGLAQATLPARCEVLCRDPWIVVDSAHTAHSAAALRRVLDRLPGRRIHWLLSLTVGKNLAELAAALLHPGDKVTVTQADASRSQAAEPLAGSLRKLYPWLEDLRCIPDPQTALRQAYQNQLEDSRDSLLCVTGSVYMAGLGRALLKPLIELKPF